MLQAHISVYPCRSRTSPYLSQPVRFHWRCARTQPLYDTTSVQSVPQLTRWLHMTFHVRTLNVPGWLVHKLRGLLMCGLSSEMINDASRWSISCGSGQLLTQACVLMLIWYKEVFKRSELLRTINSLPGRWLNLVMSSHNATANHHCPGLVLHLVTPPKVTQTTCCVINRLFHTCISGRCFPSTVLPASVFNSAILFSPEIVAK